MHPTILDTKAGATQIVNAVFTTVITLLEQSYSSIQNEDDQLFPFSQESFGTKIYQIKREQFTLKDDPFVIRKICFRLGKADEGLIQKSRFNDEMKNWDR